LNEWRKIYEAQEDAQHTLERAIDITQGKQWDGAGNPRQTVGWSRTGRIDPEFGMVMSRQQPAFHLSPFYFYFYLTTSGRCADRAASHSPPVLHSHKNKWERESKLNT